VNRRANINACRSMSWVAVLACAACAGANAPPDIAPPGPLSVTVGDTLVVPLSASDPDGDEVTFAVEGAPEGASVEKDEGGARFVYSPLASDAKPGGATYDLVFVASDGRGGEARAASTLTVEPEGAVPAFQGPFAWALDLATDDRLAVAIRVRDDDTARLDFTLHQGIEGAVFEPVDGHTASLFWKPKPAQVAAGPVFAFQVGASDRVHAETVASFVVVLLNADLFGGCPGTPPISVAGPGPDHQGGGEVALSLTAHDAESPVREAVLYWSLSPGADESSANRVNLQPSGAQGRFVGSVPDLSAAAGHGLLVYYHFVVTDDDDAAGAACDHAVRVPKQGDLALAVQATPGAACLDDALCGAACDRASPAPLPEGTVPGLRLCGATKPDVFSVALGEGHSLAVVARPMTPGAGVRVDLLDADGRTVASGDGGLFAMPGAGAYRVEVASKNPATTTYELTSAVTGESCVTGAFAPGGVGGAPPTLAEGTVQGRLCPAERDSFSLHLGAGEAARLTLAFDPAAADLDLRVEGPDGPVAESAGTVGPEQVVVEAGGADDLIVVVEAAGLGSAAYELTAAFAGQSTLCQDDLLAPNGTADSAPAVPEGTWDHLKLCPGSTDFVAIGLNGGETLTAGVEVAAGLDAPPVAILDPSGDLLASGEIAGEVAMADAKIPGPGTYLLRIGPSTSAVSYGLSFGADDPPGPCRPDRLEPNDAPGSAAMLPAGFTTHLTLCDGDVDVFGFKMGAWEALAAVLLGGSGLGRLSVIDADGAVLASGTPTAYGEEVVFVAPSAGGWFLRVGDAGAPGWYDVAIE
jgi:hypothetical protein